MSGITVSVIIPIYNAERHLEECLDSCLNQTLKSIEIICINDGSTDRTGTILESYAEKNSNIVILNQKNQGLGTARNLGMAKARGRFIAFMDSDDFYSDRNALQKLYTAAVREKVMACGGSVLFMNDGKIDKNDTGLCFRENAIMCYGEWQRTGGFTQFIYDAQFLRENEILFPTWRWYEDPPFFVAVMAKVNRFYVINDLVYIIRNTDKVVQFHDDDIVTGVLNGIAAILKISKVNRFAVLHSDMTVDLTVNFAACIYERIYHGNAQIRKRYEEVLAEFDEALLEKDSRKFRKPKSISDEEISRIFEQCLKRERMLLDKINSYNKVLIYGAGRAGRFLYQYLRKRGCKADIGFMISAENPDYTACGKQVYSIRECAGERDSALVIIANMCHIEQMVETARYYQFKHVEVVSWNELMFFGADMMDENYLTIF